MSDSQDTPEVSTSERITVRIDDGENRQLLTFRRALSAGATLAAAGLTAAMLESVVADQAYAQERAVLRPGVTRAVPLTAEQQNLVQALDLAIKERSSQAALDQLGSKLTAPQKEALASLTPEDLSALQRLQANPRLNKLDAAADNTSGSIGGTIF